MMKAWEGSSALTAETQVATTNFNAKRTTQRDINGDQTKIYRYREDTGEG